MADVMDAEPVAIPEDASVERALDEYFLRYRWPWFPVVDAAGRFLGLVERERRGARSRSVSRASSRSREVFEADRPARCGCAPTTPLEALLGNEALRRLGALMAVDADGRLRGVDHRRTRSAGRSSRALTARRARSPDVPAVSRRQRGAIRVRDIESRLDA